MSYQDSEDCLGCLSMGWCQDSVPGDSHCPRLTVEKKVFLLVTPAKVPELVLIGQSRSHTHPSANHCGQDSAD